MAKIDKRFRAMLRSIKASQREGKRFRAAKARARKLGLPEPLWSEFSQHGQRWLAGVQSSAGVEATPVAE